MISAWLLYFLVYQLLSKVDAQTSCDIRPNLTALAVRNDLTRDVELHCQCMGGNGIILNGTSWFRDGVPVAGAVDSSNLPAGAPSILLITSPFTGTNTGTYTCSPNSTFLALPPGDNFTLTTEVPSGSQRTCSIISTSLPTLTTPSGVIADGAENVILYCICLLNNNNVAAGPTMWFINGTAITDTLPNGNNPYYRNNVPSSLIIPLFGASNVGTYRCQSEATTPTPDDDRITLMLPFAPSISTEVVDAAQNEGESASFTCQATGGPAPTISWYFNNTLLANGMKYTISETSSSTTISSTLTIMSVQSSDVGTYTCNATNVVSNDTSSGVLTVNVPPTITTPIEGQLLNVTVGSNRSITCTATGYPVPTVVWQNSDGSSLSNNRLLSGPVNMLSTGVGNVTSVSVELMVIGAMRVDTGMYRCSASNSVNSTTRNVNITVQFDAQTSCDIRPDLPALAIRGGLVRDVELHCQCMDGNGMIITGTSWFHGGVSVTTTMNDQNLPTGAPSILLIDMPFDSTDSGTYTCSPDSVFPTAPPGDNITLSTGVPNDSNQRTCNINSTSLPTLTTPSGMIANGTEDVILYCICVIDNIAVGPTIWFFNNILITATQANGNDPYYRNNVPSPFIIPLFSTSNVGTYRCESVGSTSAPGDSITIMLPAQPTATTLSMVSVNEGESITIICTATGVPVPSVNWSRADGSSLTDSRYVISDTSSSVIVNDVYQVTRNLTIMNSVRDDTGMEYSCTATSALGTAQSNVSINVLFPPSIGLEVMDKIRNEGESTSFTCQATGRPVPTISWYFNNTLLGSGTKYTISETSVNTTTISSTLTIMSVESSDVGTYTCNATNIVSTDTSSRVLTVNVAPNIITPMETQQFNITEGSNGSITCTATGYPVPTVVWQNNDGSSLSSSKLVSGSSVNISSTGVGNVTSVSVELMVIGAMRVDAGMYRCSANNSVSSTTRNVIITVQFGPSSIIAVINLAEDEGDSATFNCQADGEPIPTFGWYFNGVQLNESNAAKYDIISLQFPDRINTALNILNVQSSDVGTYTCNATNVVSTDTSYGVLTVNVAPTITTPMEGQQFNITEGSDGSITCTATGYPVPTVVWQNSNGSSLSNNRLVSGSSVNISSTGVGNETSVSVELMLIGAMRVDTGMYRCLANNSVRNITRSVNITVQFGPDIIGLMNQAENEGDTASFTCQAVGEPLPTISWYFNGVLLNESNTAKYRITERPIPTASTDILNIIDVQSSDVGTYTCNATNVVSTDISSGVLTVNVVEW